MSQPTPARGVPRPDPTITGAKIALVGTIAAAVIGAAATITVALLQRKDSGSTPTAGGPATHTADANTSQSSTPSSMPPSSSPPSTPAANATSATPNGVTYRCVGTASGVAGSYGSDSGGGQFGALPFTAYSRVRESAKWYTITAALDVDDNDGYVTCTLTVTDAGRTTTSTDTARGAGHEAAPRICSGFDGGWLVCTN